MLHQKSLLQNFCHRNDAKQLLTVLDDRGRLSANLQKIGSLDMSDRKDTPIKCPACGSSFVTETLHSWICSDCGVTKESPTSKKVAKCHLLIEGY